MIKFEFEVLPEEINYKFILAGLNCYVPSSQLINKFGKLYLQYSQNQDINLNSKTSITFIDQNNEIWSDTNYLVSNKELIKNHRWETINRAITMATNRNKNINAQNIKSIEIEIR